MVVVKKKKGETEDKLIARFRKLSSGKIANYKEKIRYEAKTGKQVKNK